MIHSLVRDLAAEKIPVAVTCRVLDFSTRGYYAWCKQPVSQRDWDDGHPIDAAYDIHADNPAIGYRFIADELRGRGRGVKLDQNRIARLCSQQRIWAVNAREARALSRRAGPPAPDVLRPTDITEHATAEGELHLCAVKDACSGRLVATP
jgi:putative transposase